MQLRDGVLSQRCWRSSELRNRRRGWYARHRGFELWLDPGEGSDLYHHDATFVVRPGLADPSAVSFESVNFPGRFLRHRGAELFLDPADGTAGFAADATFRVRPGQTGEGVSLEAANPQPSPISTRTPTARSTLELSVSTSPLRTRTCRSCVAVKRTSA